MSAPIPEQAEETQPSAASEKPANKWLRLAIVLGGIVFSQIVLYGPSLIGKKILLPLDILAQPGIYIPASPEIQKLKVQDPVLSDLVFSMEPMRRFAALEFKAGRVPVWSPNQYAGGPFVWPKYSPFKLIECLTTSPVILAWSQLISALVAGLGAYLFFRRAMGVGFWPAAIAAWCYPVTGFFIFWQGYMFCGVVYWLPWLLLAVDGTVRRPGVVSVMGLSVTTCLVLISGVIDTAAQVLLASGFYSLWCIRDEHAQKWFHWPARKAALRLTMAWTLGFFLAAPQILPFWEFAQTGSRMAGRVTGSEERPPIGLAALPEVVLPDIYGSKRTDTLPIFPPGQGNEQESAATTYTGLLATLVFAPLAWGDPRKKSRNRFWLFLAVFGLSWQLNIPGVVDLLRLPGLNMISHNRFVFVSSFAILALAIEGLEGLLRGNISWRCWQLWAPVTLLGFGAWCAWRSIQLPERVGSQLESAIAAGQAVNWVVDSAGVKQVQNWFVRHYALAAALCAVGLLLWLIVWRFRAWRQNAIILFGMLMLGDLLWFGYGRNPQCEPELYYPKIETLETLRRLEPGRMVGYGCLPSALSVFLGLPDIRGYDGIDSERFVSLVLRAADPNSASFAYAKTQLFKPRAQKADQGIQLSPILDMLNVRYVIFRGVPPSDVQPDLAGNDYWMLINRNALPRVFVPRKVECISDSATRLLELSSDKFEPRDVAYVESAVDLPGECRGEARIAEETPTRVKISLKMETPGLLVLSDLWDAGWHAYLDGKQVSILRANHAIRGVVVPAGASSLEFHYEPASFAWGVRLAIFAAAVLIGWSAMALWKGKSTARIDPG